MKSSFNFLKLDFILLEFDSVFMEFDLVGTGFSTVQTGSGSRMFLHRLHSVLWHPLFLLRG